MTASRLWAVQMLEVALSRRMCCSRVEGHAVSHVAHPIYRGADDATGNIALEIKTRGEEGGVRTTVAHRNAETLAVADDHVRAHRTG